MKFSPYSHSRLDSFRTCPMKFKLQYIDKVKVPFEPNLALYKGSYIHECLEYNDDRPDFKTNKIFTPEEKALALVSVNKFKEGPIWANIIKQNYINEQKFAFKIIDAKLVSCDYWDKTSWIRGAIDVHWWEGDKIFIDDYKSGKDKSTDTRFFTNDQMKTYAVWAFTEYPHINEVQTAFIYVEHGTQRHETFHRKDLTQLIKDLYADTKSCENGERYPKKVSPLCGYCSFKEFGHCSGEVDDVDILNLVPNGLSF